LKCFRFFDGVRQREIKTVEAASFAGAVDVCLVLLSGNTVYSWHALITAGV